MVRHSTVRYILVAAFLTLSLNANADSGEKSPNADMRYAAISMQGDNENNRQLTGALSLTLGNHSWVQVGAGALHLQQQNDALNASLIDLGAGIVGRQLGFSFDVSQRKDGDKYEQQDWRSTLDWHNNSAGLGLDGLYRETELRGVMPMTSAQGTINAPVSQSLTGNGVGLHAHVNLTERVTIAAGAMHYHYDSKISQGNANATNNGGIFGTQSLLTNPSLTQISGVTREAAILQNSWNAGMIFRLQRVTLAAQYFNDQPIDNNGVSMTTAVSAAIFINEHWMLSPGIGYSSRSQSGGVTYGVLTTRYGW